MSMAINSISASGVAAMLYGMPVNKPSRVEKSGTGRTTAVSVKAGQTAVRATSRSQPANPLSNTAEQFYATFQYALAALGSVGTTGTASNYSSQIGRTPSGGVQQASSAAYAQVEAQAGQVLDITA
ncbi:MAG: hypothetical protein WCJ35_12525 [Planctomycetota bacterium]